MEGVKAAACVRTYAQRVISDLRAGEPGRLSRSVHEKWLISCDLWPSTDPSRLYTWQSSSTHALSQENINRDLGGGGQGQGKKKWLASIRSGVVLMQVEGGDEWEHAAKRQEEEQARRTDSWTQPTEAEDVWNVTLPLKQIELREFLTMLTGRSRSCSHRQNGRAAAPTLTVHCLHWLYRQCWMDGKTQRHDDIQSRPENNHRLSSGVSASQSKILFLSFTLYLWLFLLHSIYNGGRKFLDSLWSSSQLDDSASCVLAAEQERQEFSFLSHWQKKTKTFFWVATDDETF